MSRLHPIFNTPDPVTRPSRFSKGEWQLLECTSTGLVYLDNPPEYAALEEDFAWEKTYEAERLARKRREPLFSKLSSLGKWIRLKVRKTPKIVTLPTWIARRNAFEGGSIRLLDVGCGSGKFTRRIAQHMHSQTGRTVIPSGIEISRGLAQQAGEELEELHGKVIQASAIEGLEQFGDASQDVIIMHSFLEHEINPLGLLKASKAKLSPSGVIIIKVPNFGSWNRKIRQGRWCGFRYPDHVNYFSPGNLKLLLETAGLRVHRMRFDDRLPTSDNMWVVAERA